jgi:hypothetical protein
MVRECCWRTVEVEVASFVDEHAAQLTEDGTGSWCAMAICRRARS